MYCLSDSRLVGEGLRAFARECATAREVVPVDKVSLPGNINDFRHFSQPDVSAADQESGKVIRIRGYGVALPLNSTRVVMIIRSLAQKDLLGFSAGLRCNRTCRCKHLGLANPFPRVPHLADGNNDSWDHGGHTQSFFRSNALGI